MRLWEWHFYHSCQPIDRRIIFWILKNLTSRDTLSLTLRDTLRRTPKVISNQNLFSRFQSWCCFWCWPLQKNQAIYWPWKFWGHRVFHYSRVGVVVPPSAKKWPNRYPSESPPTKFVHYYYLKLSIKV